jgi:hypothetical protein
MLDSAGVLQFPKTSLKEKVDEFRKKWPKPNFENISRFIIGCFLGYLRSLGNEHSLPLSEMVLSVLSYSGGFVAMACIESLLGWIKISEESDKWLVVFLGQISSYVLFKAIHHNLVPTLVAVMGIDSILIVLVLNFLNKKRILKD